MKKKVIAIAVVVAMLAIGAISSTLAYFTDSEFNDNVMTVGNVDITQDEVFDDTTIIQGGQTVDKQVTVNNVGQGDAYIRTFIAMEDTFETNDFVTPNFYTDAANYVQPTDGAGDYLQIMVEDTDGKYEADDKTWTVYTVGLYDYAAAGLANSILPDGESVQSLKSLSISEDIDNDFYARAGEKYDVLVLTQAAQVGDFATADDAFAAAFGTGAIDNTNDAEVAAWFAEYYDVEVRPFSSADYPAEEQWPVWQDQAGEVVAS